MSKAKRKVNTLVGNRNVERKILSDADEKLSIDPSSGEKNSRPIWPKKKVAILMGYSGSGYQGMQLNPNARTIESELFKALCADELISADNAVDPKKVGWMRACRTDKGVHAAGQVVSLKMLIKSNNETLPLDTPKETNQQTTEEVDSLKKIVERLNLLLPPQIKIFGIHRTANSFHAKERTDSRFYEYLLPTYVFRAVSSPEIYKPTKQPVETIQKDSLDPANTFDNDKSTQSSIEEDLQGNAENMKSVLDDLGDDEAIVQELVEDDSAATKFSTLPSAAELAEMALFRISKEQLQEINQMLGRYHGTHYFHNFTIGMTASNPSSRRHIYSTTVSEPFVRPDGREWISIVFHGQSFMLHQIRKMVGLVIMAIRLGSSVYMGNSALLVDKCLQASTKVNIPKAPAEGLLLDKAIFSGYNRTNPDRDPIDFDDYAQERDVLKSQTIYPQIFFAEETTNCFAGWLKCNDFYASEFSFLVQPN